MIKAAKILEDQYDVAADVWSVTSYQELYRDGHAVERWNRLHPGEKPRVPYVTQCFAGTEGVIVAASDYVKILPDGIDRWLPRPLTSLGTDGFGRSENRAALRDFFEVDAKFVVAVDAERAREGRHDRDGGRREGDQGSRDQYRKAKPGHFLNSCRHTLRQATETRSHGANHSQMEISVPSCLRGPSQ